MRQRDKLRPYAFALLLLAVSLLLSNVGGSRLHTGFPWALVSLLVVCTVAVLWGGRPALVVLCFMALLGDRIVPGLHISLSRGHTGRDGALEDTLERVLVTRALLFAVCGGAVIAVAHQSRVMRESAERRRAVVQALQRMLLPERLAEVPGFERAALYQPARTEEEVGGDFYDLFPVGGDGEFAVLVGDVIGKGKEAAAFTALLRYSTRAYAALGLPPAEILARVNALVDAPEVTLETATLFVGLLDSRSGRLRYASAGHEPPLLCRAGDGEEALRPTGPLLGFDASLTYEEMAVTLGPGDALLLMTDGVTEARSPRGEFLETEGAWRLLRPALAAGNAKGALRRFYEGVFQHSGRRLHDDVALLLLRRATESERRGGVSPATVREQEPAGRV